MKIYGLAPEINVRFQIPMLYHPLKVGIYVFIALPNAQALKKKKGNQPDQTFGHSCRSVHRSLEFHYLRCMGDYPFSAKTRRITTSTFCRQ